MIFHDLLFIRTRKNPEIDFEKISMDNILVIILSAKYLTDFFFSRYAKSYYLLTDNI